MSQETREDADQPGRPVLWRFITIAILGGTGKEGKGLAYRWARAGYRVLIGSRTPDKAVRVAAEVRDMVQGPSLIEGMDNLRAAEAGDIVVMTVPYAAHQKVLQSVEPALEGKILVDTSVPLKPPRVSTVQLPPAGSAAMEAQNLLGPDVNVVAAFQNISYQLLLKDEPVECDVLVCGRGRQARQEVLKLVEAAGLVGWDAGPIENAGVVEGLTSVLIGLNKQYGIQHAGLRITGIPSASTTGSPEAP